MSEKLNDSGVVELTGKIMVVAIIVLFLVVAFVFFLHLYAKWFWYRREDQLDGPHRRRRRRSNFAGGHEELTPAAILRRGLDAAALKSIPVVLFDPKDFKDGLECAVCLSELNQGEKTRILPRCKHGFHVECIDMWFLSHSTCPICRSFVSDQSAASTTEISVENLLETTPAPQNPTDFPTNVLFWGNEVRVSSGDPQLEDGLYQSQQGPPAASLMEEDQQSSASSSSSSSSEVLVIDIPTRRIINSEDHEDQKSPITSRMMSFKRLFGRDKRVSPSSPPSSDHQDLEQGGSS